MTRSSWIDRYVRALRARNGPAAVLPDRSIQLTFFVLLTCLLLHCTWLAPSPFMKNIIVSFSSWEQDSVGGTNAQSSAGTTSEHVAALRTTTAAIDWSTSRLTPFLREVSDHLLAKSAEVERRVATIRQTLQRLQYNRKRDAALHSQQILDAKRVPWYALREPHERPTSSTNGRAMDFATFSGLFDRFLASIGYTSQLYSDSLSENVTFATNSADKLAYQLRNWESIPGHRFSTPNWNGVSLASQKKLYYLKGSPASASATKWDKYQQQQQHSSRAVGKAFLIGISSVNRVTNYLVSTLASFVSALSDEEKAMIQFVILNAEFPADNHEDIASVRLQFPEEMASGFFEVVTLPRAHPELQHNGEHLARRWGDSLDRVRWRSKQVLDVAYLMEYCSSHPHGFDYFLMMEDDILAAKHFVRRLRVWLDAHLLARTDWTMASFYNPWEVQDLERLPPEKFFGVIGQLFRMHDLPVVAEFLRKNFDQSPLDWLFVDFLKKFNGSIVVHVPSLFQHQGQFSSLEGKEQTGRSVDFQEEE